MTRTSMGNLSVHPLHNQQYTTSKKQG